MWTVVTSQQSFEMLPAPKGGLLGGEIDELLAALAALQPAPTRSARKVLPFKAKNGSHPITPLTQADEVTLDISRPVNAPVPAPCPSNEREPLRQLRAAILVAAETQGLRTVLLCGAEATDDATDIGARLSQSLADYDRLKVAHIAVRGEPQAPANRRKVLPLGYTFQLRRTQKANLYEIASSLGAVRLDDWLRWWNPTVVLQEMKKMFDLIVIHAPAITTTPDVALLAAAADGVILVATEHVTSYAGLETAQQQLRAANARILGVTTNQLPVTQRGSTAARLRKLMAEWVKSK
jgi:hypothetical protein